MAGRWQSLFVAFDVCRSPVNLRRTLEIALAVGCVITAANQGDVIGGGEAGGATGLKIALNFLIPFVSSNLGVLAFVLAPRERG
jgi:hypothetical protein